MSFGQRLKGLRRGLDLSQAELADRAGCSVNTVRKLESGERRPSRELATRLAAVFEVPQRDRAEFLRLARGSQSLARPGLPSPMTRLIGREQDIATVRDRLLGPDVRLLTLVGPPGVGKTRLALQVAMEVQEVFRDGAAFVALAAVREASLVLDSVAHVLGVRGTPSRSLEQALIEHLRQRHLLLVLDNFEQVLTAREHLPVLLSAAAKLKVLVTSREALDLYGEHVYGVPTLGLPNLQARQQGHVPPRSPSELLFLERARAARPGFASSAGDQPLVAEICLRLEGLPLAIELAASRARTMGPGGMLAELSRRLDVLSAGPTDFSPRQRSIRGALDWSYELLNEDERCVFERMALFAGGATQDAILSVSGEHWQPEAIRQVIESLADKSLLTLTEVADMTRLGMLETIREYALERLTLSQGPADVEAQRRRHAAYFAALADAAPGGLRGRDQVRWLNRLETDHDNMRAALAWSVQNREAELAARLAAGLWPFWRARGYFHEGRHWLHVTLGLGADLPPASRAAILNGAGVLAILQADYQVATARLNEALEVFRAVDDQRGVAFAVSNLGWLAHDCADAERAAALFEESLALRRAIGDTWGEASSINNLGMIAVSRDDWRGAARLFEESASLFRRVGDLMSLAQALTNQGWALHLLGDHPRASELFSESLDLARRFQDARGVATNLSNLALMALYRGEYAQAHAFYADSLAAFNELADKRGIAESLEGLAGVAGVQGRPRDAARLFGLAAALREAVGAPLLAGDRARYESATAAAREQLEDAAWTQAWEEGRAASFEQELAKLLG